MGQLQALLFHVCGAELLWSDKSVNNEKPGNTSGESKAQTRLMRDSTAYVARRRWISPQSRAERFSDGKLMFCIGITQDVAPDTGDGSDTTFPELDKTPKNDGAGSIGAFSEILGARIKYLFLCNFG